MIAVIAAADRLYDAADELDRLRGDSVASDWLAHRLRELNRTGQAGDVARVVALAESLERRIVEIKAAT